MNYKLASPTTITRDLRGYGGKTGNIYESVAIISKRANQIAATMKEELNEKFGEFAPTSDTLEEVFENAEQIEISKHYERLPKPVLISIQEFVEGKVYSRNPSKDSAPNL